MTGLVGSAARRAIALGLAVIAIGVAGGNCALAAGLVTREVRPSTLDANVKSFDEPSVAVFNPGAPTGRPLAIFMPGTGGKPANVTDMLRIVAGQGYRVIGLEYDDEPAGNQVCARSPDPGCLAAFRAMRVYGPEDPASRGALVANSAAESVVARLIAVLGALNAHYPAEGWGAYLKDGAPDWSRIVVSGLSQGAGMAAYIAKREPVARVVLFSSPWDWTGPDRRPAPWLTEPSKTPPDRWWAEYHRRENTAEALKRAYAALNIPNDHLLVFDNDIPARFSRTQSPNPFHGLTVRDDRYAPQWRSLFGRGDAPSGAS